jgi:4-hydroxy-tetrahydrodipicolinate reductase
MAIPLIVNGAHGRMGRSIMALGVADPAFALIAGVNRMPGTVRELGIPSDAPVLTALPVHPGAVVVDFSHPLAFAGVCRHCAQHGMALVSGTTGVAPEDLAQGLAEAASRSAVMWAANMSVGVNVVLAVAARLATTLGPDYDIEIVEAHHHHKKDAPSGTALAIADSILGATQRTRADLVDGRSGQCGERRRGEIGMHALRMGDVVGDHVVYFVGGGERITLGHVAHSREIFAQGALRAARYLAQAAPGRYTMSDVLGLR